MFILNHRNGKTLAQTRHETPTQPTVTLCPNDCPDGEKCKCKPKKRLNKINEQFDYDASAPFQLKRHVTGKPIILKSSGGKAFIKQRSKELLDETPNQFNQRDDALRTAALLTELEKQYDIQKQTEWATEIIIDFLSERRFEAVEGRLDAVEDDGKTVKDDVENAKDDLQSVKEKQVFLEAELTATMQKQQAAPDREQTEPRNLFPLSAATATPAYVSIASPHTKIESDKKPSPKKSIPLTVELDGPVAPTPPTKMAASDKKWKNLLLAASNSIVMLHRPSKVHKSSDSVAVSHRPAKLLLHQPSKMTRKPR